MEPAPKIGSLALHDRRAAEGWLAAGSEPLPDVEGAWGTDFAPSPQLLRSITSTIPQGQMMQIPNPQLSEATYGEIAAYRPRYAELFDDVRRDVEELVARGAMSRATDLAARTGHALGHTQYPMYFTGDLDAEVVLVHLNPKEPTETTGHPSNPYPVKTFEEYFDVHRHWGARTYGVGGPRPTSPFDKKQVKFLRPFRAIKFVDETLPDALYTNLERVVDHKLQLELIPYNSRTFETDAFPASVVKPHFERVLRVISARPRRYVLFCGRVFGPMLREFIVKTHQFHLSRNDKLPERMLSEFSNLLIGAGSSVVAAGWCPSWTRRGLPMASYAKEVVSRYDEGSPHER